MFQTAQYFETDIKIPFLTVKKKLGTLSSILDIYAVSFVSRTRNKNVGHVNSGQMHVLPLQTSLETVIELIRESK